MSEQKEEESISIRRLPRQETDNIVHGTFVKQGTMLAFPTGFPGATIPILADESHITALDVSPQGFVYGGTSGKRAHIFVGMFHGVTGMIFDMKAVEDATHCAAVCCGKSKFLACVNGPSGGRDPHDQATALAL